MEEAPEELAQHDTIEEMNNHYIMNFNQKDRVRIFLMANFNFIFKLCCF